MIRPLGYASTPGSARPPARPPARLPARPPARPPASSVVQVDCNFDGKVSFLEYLLYQYRKVVSPADFCKRAMEAEAKPAAPAFQSPPRPRRASHGHVQRRASRAAAAAAARVSLCGMRRRRAATTTPRSPRR